MKKLICPECDKSSYSADTRCFSNCPYCGKKFSGTQGLDKRRENRTLYEASGIFRNKDKTRHN